jgi:hypothetical protein
MKQKLFLVVALVVGLVLGVALSSWRAFPTDDMIARASCASCHDVHAAIEWEDAPFQSQIWILGDVPEATYILVNDLFPYRNSESGDSISLLELVARYGAHDVSRVAIESLDGGIVTLTREYLTPESMLVPYMEGVRFKDQNQHESTWLKGVRWIIVEGAATPLMVDGQATSMGRLLLQDRTTVIAEGGDAIYKSPLDGKTYRGDYAHTYTGARLSQLLPPERSYTRLKAVDEKGRSKEYTRDEVADALIATVSGRPTLLLPHSSRGQWVSGVVEITALP